MKINETKKVISQMEVTFSGTRVMAFLYRNEYRRSLSEEALIARLAKELKGSEHVKSDLGFSDARYNQLLKELGIVNAGDDPTVDELDALRVIH